MIELQERLEGSLIAIGFTKICGFFLWKFAHFEKESLKEFLATTRGTQKTAQTAGWLCEPINF